MTDTHSHLLYGFDDGAADKDSCRRMLDLYAAGGVKTVVCSSHSSANCDNKYEECFSCAAELAAGCGVTLLPALEYSLPDVLASQQHPLGDGRYLLLDPALFPVEPSLFTRLQPLNAAGFSFLWAHPERLYLHHAVSTVDKFNILNGSACQLNAGSFLGVYGSEVKSAAWELLAAGCCAVIASDAHDPNGVSNFIKCRKLLETLYPDEFIRLWFESNPGRILAGKKPERRMPPPLSVLKRLKRAFFH